MDKDRLSRPNQLLIQECQRTNFGRITLHVRNGEPDLAQPWRTLRTVKLSGAECRDGARPELHKSNFVLCKEQTALLALLESLPDAVCITIEVKHGLPFLIEVEEDHKAA